MSISIAWGMYVFATTLTCAKPPAYGLPLGSSPKDAILDAIQSESSPSSSSLNVGPKVCSLLAYFILLPTPVALCPLSSP